MKALLNGAGSVFGSAKRLAAYACVALLVLSCEPPVTAGQDPAAPDAVPDAVPPATGSLALRATGARSQSVALAWDAASDDGSAADALEYSLYSTTGGDFSTLDGIKAGTPVLAWTRGCLAATATGLSPDTSYSFGLVVRDESGNEAAYAALSASTGKGFELLPSLVGPEHASPAPGSLTGYDGKL